MNGIGRTVMAEITEQTFKIKKSTLIFATLFFSTLICLLFFVEHDYSLNIYALTYLFITVFLQISFLSNIIFLVFIRPIKIVVNSAGICGITILGKKSFFEWEKIKKIENYHKKFVYTAWPFLKYSRIEVNTNREKLFIPLSLKNKPELDKIMREMIDDEKVLKKLGVV